MAAFQLSRHVCCTHYDLTFDIDMDKRLVRSKAMLDLAVNGTQLARASGSPCELLLHAGPHFTFKRVWCRDVFGHTWSVRYEYPARDTDPAERLLRLHVSSTHTLGGFTAIRSVCFEYDAPLDQEPMTGLYTSLVPTQGLTLASQLQPIAARMVFPCFDEPAFRATFTIHARVVPPTPTSCTAAPPATCRWHLLSNMPAEHVDTDGWVTFGTTPRMPTYLLALVAAPLRLVATRTLCSGSAVRVWALPHQQAPHAQRIADTAAAVMDDLAAVLQQPYTLPKIDLVPVSDFDAGGMENWGCVLFEAEALHGHDSHEDGDDGDDGGDDGELAATLALVAHEVVHQWFGNLVTAPSWTDVWLSEGLTTFVSTWCLARLAQGRPEAASAVWADFAAVEVPSALGAAGLPGALPIAGTRMRTAEDAPQMFDSRSYAKAALVLRMVWAHIGDVAFVHALRTYVHTCVAAHDGIASEALLLAAFESVSTASVATAVHTWLHRSGMPLLVVDTSADVVVSHSRFALLSSASSSVNGKWPLLLPRPSVINAGSSTACALATALPAAVLCIDRHHSVVCDVERMCSMDATFGCAAALAQLAALRLVTLAGLVPVRSELRATVERLAAATERLPAAVTKAAAALLRTWTTLRRAALPSCSAEYSTAAWPLQQQQQQQQHQRIDLDVLTEECANGHGCCSSRRHGAAAAATATTVASLLASVDDVAAELHGVSPCSAAAAAVDSRLQAQWHAVVSRLGALGASELCALVSSVVRSRVASMRWHRFFTALAKDPAAVGYDLAVREAQARCLMFARGVDAMEKCAE